MTNKGDLISRSALKEEMVSGCRRIGEAMGVVLPTLAFVNIIDNAPPVNVEITEKQAIITIINSGWLVKHDKELREKWARPQGKWIEQTDYVGDTYYECSVCKEPWTTIEGTPMQNFMNYCPNCGAKMDGGEEE